MAAREERRRYIAVRRDGYLLRTKPVTRWEAWWLYWDAYFAGFLDRESRVRYLEEWGNVLDVGEHLERLEQLEPSLYYRILGLYRGPDRFAEKLNRLLSRGDLQPEVRQTLEDLLGKARDFLARPVEPKPIGPRPVRYFEMEGRHIELGPDGAVQEARPRPMWYACKEFCCGGCHGHGVSVFPDSIWLWLQSRWYVQAVVVRRDVSDKDVVAAVANDGAVQGFLKGNADGFRELIREREADLIDRGYDDVVRKAKAILTAAQLLNAGRREEEALPA